MTGLSELCAAIASHGVAHTPALVSHSTLDALQLAFEAGPRRSTAPMRRQHNAQWETHEQSADGWVVNPLLNPHRLPGHPDFAQACTRIVEDGGLVACASAILGRPATLFQTAFYESGLGSAPHRDDHPTRADGHMVAVLVALEPMEKAGGTLVLWPGTHALDDPTLDRLGRAVWLKRHAARENADDEAAQLQAHIEASLTDWQPTLATLPKGDAVWWDRRTVHGSLAPSIGSGKTRRSFIAHFIPTDETPQSSS